MAWTEITPPGRDLADGAHQIGRGRVLEHVRAGAALQRLDHVRLARVHREDQDARSRRLLRHLTQGLQPVAGHHEIEDQHVGGQAYGHLGRRRAIGGLSDDDQVGRGFQQGPEALAHDVMVVGENN